MNVGDAVAYSPNGSGVITDFTERGYPRVNEVAVGTLILTDGRVFNPHGHDLEALKVFSENCDRSKS